ncbi:MAG: hypothetical protein KKH94_01250, partial [Candidatus Omnitrophica bacterium]|nr:hypothetical protein [Candidatus Omnitrophota bacterium]
MKTNILKIISLIIVVIFTTNTIVLSAPDLVYRVNIPKKYGKIKERWKAAEPKQFFQDKDARTDIIEKKSRSAQQSQPTVVIVEDAHTSAQAQENISHIVGELVNTHDVSLVGIEGAEGDLDTHAIRSFPFQETKEKVLSYFREKGKISGAEYQAFVSTKDVNLFGIEEKDLYIKNHSLYTETLSDREYVQQYLKRGKKLFKKLQKKYYSPTLLALSTLIDAYRNNKEPFTSYFGALLEHTASFDIPTDDYLNITILKDASGLLNTIDEDVLKKEYAYLNQCFIGDSKEEDEHKVIEETNTRGQYIRLISLAQAKGIEESHYRNMKRQIEYEGRLNQIRYQQLFHECDELTNTIMMHLAGSEEEKKLFELTKLCEDIEPLIRLEARPYDIATYRNNQEKFSSSYLNNLARHFFDDTSAMKDAYQRLDTLLPRIDEFYTTVEARNRAFVDTALATMEKQNQKATVMVSGGYHTQGLTKLLQERGVSYLVITPAMTSEAFDFSYKDLMVGKHGRYDTFIATSLSTLQTIRSCWPLFKNEIEGRKQGGYFQKQIGAELFSEEAKRRIQEEGSTRLSNIEFKEELSRAGWKYSDLYNITAIFEIGEELGLVETRINNKGSIYKVFREPPKNLTLLPQHKEKIISAVRALLARELKQGTYTTDEDKEFLAELTRIQEETDDEKKTIFIRTLLQRLPHILPLELDVLAEDKETILDVLLPRVNVGERFLRNEVVELFTSFKQENPSSFDITREDTQTSVHEVGGFVESKLLLWLSQKFYTEINYSDDEQLAKYFEELKQVAADALVLFFNELYTIDETADDTARVMGQVSRELSAYLNDLKVTFKENTEKDIPECFAFTPRSIERDKIFIVFPQDITLLNNAGIKRPIDVVFRTPRPAARQYQDLPHKRVRRPSVKAISVRGLLDQDGTVAIDEAIEEKSSEERAVLYHEVKGHMVTAHLRKYNPPLFQKIVDTIFNDLQPDKRLILLRSFVTLAIPFETDDVTTLSLRELETVLATSEWFTLKNKKGEVIGFDRAKVTDELLAWWQQLRNVPEFVHPYVATATITADELEKLTVAGKTLHETITNLFKVYNRATVSNRSLNDTILRRAGYYDSWQHILEKDPAGLEAMAMPCDYMYVAEQNRRAEELRKKREKDEKKRREQEEKEKEKVKKIIKKLNEISKGLKDKSLNAPDVQEIVNDSFEHDVRELIIKRLGFLSEERKLGKEEFDVIDDVATALIDGIPGEEGLFDEGDRELLTEWLAEVGIDELIEDVSTSDSFQPFGDDDDKSAKRVLDVEAEKIDLMNILHELAPDVFNDGTLASIILPLLLFGGYCVASYFGVEHFFPSTVSFTQANLFGIDSIMNGITWIASSIAMGIVWILLQQVVGTGSRSRGGEARAEFPELSAEELKEPGDWIKKYTINLTTQVGDLTADNIYLSTKMEDIDYILRQPEHNNAVVVGDPELADGLVENIAY